MNEQHLRIATSDGIDLDAVRCQPEGTPSSRVLLVHGITAEKNEGGMYERLAVALASRGIESIRFSFRGHGESTGGQQSVTLGGEMLDIAALLHESARHVSASMSVVASSFGAVPLLALMSSLDSGLNKVVLWNPVLSLKDTFFEPTLPWGRANFGPAKVNHLRPDDSVSVEGEFALPAVLFAEMSRYDPASDFACIDSPMLVLHGDRDSYVSFDIARRVSSTNPRSTFVAISGADHGFDSPQHEAEAIARTVDFLADLDTSTA